MRLRFQVLLGPKEVMTFQLRKDLIEELNLRVVTTLETIRSHESVPTGGLSGQIISELTGEVISSIP